MYDRAGNILSRTEYAYTADTLGTPTQTVTYTYGNSAWGDQLTAMGDRAFTYDAIGNVLNDGQRTYTWEHGRQLATLTQNGATWTNTYDVNGLRMKRTDGTNTYQYYYIDGNLVSMTYNGSRLYFAYTPDGLPYGVEYGGTQYVYALNPQGDVMAILNTSGAAVVQYTYDAWGNILSVTGSMADTLGEINPLRYRGYVYDNETQLYFLQSRYYDPEQGRFINADGQISAPGNSILGNNMYAYCQNNPVNNSDPTGNWPKWLENTVKVVSVVVAVAAVVATVAAVSAFTAGTGSAAAVYGAGILLGAALSGINGGVANEAKGNSYTNGYIGGATGGAIQAASSKSAAGTIVGGGVGVTVGTTVTDVMNNLDPDSKNSTSQEIARNAVTSGGKALITSSLTAYMGHASNLAVSNGANGLMPNYTTGFGEGVKAFFGWLDDALVYIWE